MTKAPSSSKSDHDLLIEVATKMDAVKEKVDDLASNTVAKVNQHDETLASWKELKIHRDETEKDFEARIRALEQWRWIIVGALALASTIVTLVIEYHR